MKEPSQDSSHTLLLAPALDADVDTRLFETLSELSLEEMNLLVLSYQQGPDSWLADWQTHVGQLPKNVGFIHIGGVTRSTAASTPSPPAHSPFQFMDVIGDPADLTGLGVQISQYLEQWTNTDGRTVLYLDSLTTLLQFVELDRAYRFLHVLNGRLNTVTGRGYYRLDPGAHDTQTQAVLRSLMDEVRDLSA